LTVQNLDNRVMISRRE